MRENSIDIDTIHEMFMAGEKLISIARKFDVSEGYIQQIVSRERKKNPGMWPKRMQKKSCDTCKFRLNEFLCEECIHNPDILFKDHWEGK